MSNNTTKGPMGLFDLQMQFRDYKYIVNDRFGDVFMTDCLCGRERL